MDSDKDIRNVFDDVLPKFREEWVKQYGSSIMQTVKKISEDRAGAHKPEDIITKFDKKITVEDVLNKYKTDEKSTPKLCVYFD